MKQMRRWLAMMLCLTMLVGAVPVNAAAAGWGDLAAFVEKAVTTYKENGGTLPEGLPAPTEETTETTEATEAAGETEATEATDPTLPGDDQADDGVLQILALSDYTASMESVLSQVKAANPDIDDLMFLGDSVNLYGTLLEARVSYVLDGNVTVVQGDKDAKTAVTAESGAKDNDAYGVFVINEADYDENMDGILADLSAYLTEKVRTGYEKPVFILSHRSIHAAGNWSAVRLAKQLNEAGEQGLNLIFLFGDTGEDYLGQNGIFMPVGTEMGIEGTEYVQTLNYTYMNAGTASETMTVFTFNDADGSVSVTRYDASGVAPLKDEGSYDKTVVESPAVIGEVLEIAPEDLVFGTFNLTKQDGTATAAVESTIVIAGSDYQNTAGGAFSDVTATGAYKVMAQIAEDYATANGFLFGGDYYAHSTYTTAESTAGKNQLQNDIVKYFYPDIEHEVYIQGNHDAASLAGGVLAASGANDTAKYGVYVINEKDYMWYNNDQATIKSTASALESYLDAKIEAGYNKPIFVLSHLPLHYSNRTINEGDGKYAKYIYDVLDEAGKNDLNIIFLYGHNHSTSYYEEYLGNGAVYLAEGDTIYIANEGSTSSCFRDTLNFTYMNYGFTGYLTGTAADGALTMTVFEITDDQVVVKRYDESGVHNLKSAGTNGSTPSGTTYNATVYTSPQTIALTTPEAKATYTSNGVTVTAGGITGVTASKEESPAYNASLYSGYEVYNIEATDYEAGKNAEITITLTDGDFDTTRAVTVKFPDGHTEDVTVVEGKITVESDALGAFTLSQKKQTIIEGEDDTTTDPSEPTTTTIWRQVTQFTAGKEYLLVNYGENASGVGTYAINSSAGGTAVTVLTDSEGAYIETATDAIIWNAIASGDQVKLQNASNSNYLYIASTPSGNNSVDLAVTTNSNQNYMNWSMESNSNADSALSVRRSGRTTYYPVRWSNGGSEYLVYTSTQTIKYDNWVAIFEKTEVTTGGTDTSEKTYVRVDSLSELVSGERYLFFFDSGNLMMTPEEYSYNSRTGMKYMDSPVTVGGETITGDLAAYEFTLTSSGTGWVLSNGTQELALTEYSSYDDTKKALTWENDGTAFTITGSSGNYNIYAYFDGSDTYFDENSRGMVSGYTYASGTVANFYIYRLNNEADKPTGNIIVTLDKDSGTVRQNAGVAAYTGAKLTMTYADGTTETVNVTVGMLRDADGNTISTEAPGAYSGLSVVYTYNGTEYTICDNFTLTVRENVHNDYPEYPDEGAVKVSKTGTGIDFQSSGIVEVEISASGVPSKKGVDVIVMVDTSSSMKRGAGTNDEASAPNRRIDFLQVALANLIREFQAVGDDGEQLDVNVAIAEFNGYSFISSEDEPSDTSQQTATNVAQVFTGDGSKTAGAFVQASSIADPDAFAANVGEHSGTNYDYAFDTVYRLGSAINAQNDANNEDRDLFVIFMSDGAPYGYNYYGSATTDTWDDYLNGNMTLNDDGQIVDDTGVYLKNNTHFYRTDGKHWMAEAIKGTTDQSYVVIDPTDSMGEDVTLDYFETNYLDTGIILDANNAEYMRSVPGLGAEMHTIGFCLYDDDQGGVNIVTADTQKKIMQSLASTNSQGNLCYHETESGEDLNQIFCDIASEIAYAASNARFVDQMGSKYDLQMETATYTVVNDDNATTEKTLTPKIEILSYDIWTRQDYLNGTITEDQIGDRKGTYTVLETVTFNADGTEAYSDQINGGATNILANGTQEGYVAGVIYAKTFLYNTNSTDVVIDGINYPGGTTTNTLPAETFYWKLGTVQTTELAMRYYVYLTESMEGYREGGSYETNNFAILYYDNYLGNACSQQVVSPVMAWKEALVSYAFYLVDENGNIIVNQTTGQTGSFAHKIAVTNPVVHDIVMLNNLDQVRSIDVASVGVLPEGYELYDTSSVYTVTINSNTTGSWEIQKSDNKVASTYVMQYDSDDASAYSNALLDGVDESGETVVTGHDYTHTIVWFAVLWKVQALPDTVVVDYGLPVDISVLTNDMFGENGKLAGVGPVDDANLDGVDSAMNSAFKAEYKASDSDSDRMTYGDAKIDAATGKVRYTLNTMEMNGYDKFAYAVNYTGSENTGYYYDTVTVIPATTIYYEDSFVDYSSYTWDYTANGWKETDTSLWTHIPSAVIDATQDEDRPGEYSLTDANNIYGYDSVNLGMAQYSLGGYAKATVDYDNYAEASFTFYGTGFDIISMTSNMTGTILIDVVKENNGAWTEFDNFAVDTYYGYMQKAGDADGNGTVEAGEMIWVVDPDASSSLYQVPVIKMADKDYGHYRVTIKATYDPAFDHVEGSNTYDFYLDAIRIYDPANDGAVDDDTVIEDAYKADGEGWPSYIELRNQLIEQETLGNEDTGTEIVGLVFIDGDEEVNDAQLSDYVSYGPNNEVYLAPGQRVAFIMDKNDNMANVHIGIKSADGKTGTYTITNIARNTDSENNITAGQYYNAKTYTVDTTTDMYYDLTSWVKGDIIVISNTGDRYNTEGIISLTNIKTTYESDPNGTAAASEIMTLALEETGSESGESYIYMTPAAATLTLRSLNDEIEDAEPEETVPETTEPEETVPETTVPETTEPEETVPETTTPEETQPEEDPAQEAIKKTVQAVKKFLQSLFGGWFK